ncbi:MAG: hypothetical protein ACI9UA_000233 [Pseudoalteromonas tetraodonis]|jgi:hypothetical protein
MSRFYPSFLLFATLGFTFTAHAEEGTKIEHPEFSAEQVEFFSKEVRPILANSCFKCHGKIDSKGHAKAKGGLQLISRRGLMIGGDHGAVIDETNPAESPLLKMISHSDPQHAMPPKSKLPEETIATLTKWVEMKAPWTADDIDVLNPLEEESSQTKINATTQAFWSNKPLTRPALPQIEGAKHPIDAFINAKLNGAGLKQNARANKATLIRRAYYNLIGLPPSPEQVAAFIKDESPQAWENLIEDLLGSPHYGERWARHWLDVVRYAESNGFERDSEKKEIWRYRDYVVKAFNEDKPYDQFVREQIAGDELEEITVDAKIATGFHRLMQWDDEPVDRHQARYDVMDDILRTTTEGFLAITVGCARCHDHKADPIPQTDYYSFMAFFNGLTNHDKSRVIENVVTPAMRPAVEQRKAELAADAKQIIAERAEFETEANRRFAAKDKEIAARLAGSNAEQIMIPDSRKQPHQWHYTTTVPDESWYNVGFRAENEGWKLAPGGFGSKGTPNSKARTDWKTSDIWMQTSFQLITVPKKMVMTIYHDEEAQVYLNGQLIRELRGHVTNYTEIALGTEATQALQTGRNVVSVHCKHTKGGQFIDLGLHQPKLGAFDIAKLIRQRGKEIFTNEELKRYENFRRELTQIENGSRMDVGVRAMIVQESGSKPAPMHVHIRGNANAPGEQVEPGFPLILGGGPAEIPNPKPGAKSSGRRTVLAEWMTSPTNPRTSRVMMNRLWQHHFGRGICPTSSDFGYLGEMPTHPELLDWLASEFVAKGWSIKDMHRLIMSSEAYQMSSAGNTQALAQDPTNGLFWRFNMRRLSAEEIRDSILNLSGNLNLQLGGPSMYPTLDEAVLATSSTKGGKWGKSSPEEQSRRSIYITVKRSLKPPEIESFDFADTDAPCPVRFTTTVPTQALNMLNSRFLNEQAATMAENLRERAGGDVAKQVRLGLQTALSRQAQQDEIDHCLTLIEKLKTEHGLDQDKALERLCLLVLNLNEFIYLD